MLTVKSVESSRSKSIKNTDITTKKIEKNFDSVNPLISGVSVGLSPGNTDIAAKKKIKDLTFVFRCAKRMG
jgi:hypothetical protein